ncbi:MAG: MAPEG family protein [Bosea sp. (in: a-proteobacteria)]
MRLIFPALAQIGWMFVVFGIMFAARRQALVSRTVRMKDIALSGDAWPDRAKAAANNFSNQFETPVIFFALILIANEVGAKGWIMVTLAWVYVASRVVHTLIHVTSNIVMRRAYAFFVGVIALIAMWIGIIATIL